MKRFNYRILFFMFFLMMSLLSQAQHMFFHLLPGFGTPFTWVGFGGDANWNTAANWSEGIVPTASDVASFDDRCVSNCDPTINVAISVSGIDIKSTYAGTLTQAAGQTIDIGSAGWKQAGGTFNGGDANVTLNGSTLNLSGTAIYNATSARTYFNLTQGASAVVLNVPVGTTLNFPNGSLQKFHVTSGCGAPNYSFNSPQKLSFYDVEISVTANGCGYSYFGNSSVAIEIRNDFNFLTNDRLLFVGTTEFYGNITTQGFTNFAGYGNDDYWVAMGTVSKTFSGPGGLGFLTVNKTGGASFIPTDAAQTFELHGLRVQSGTFTFPQTLNFLLSSTVSKTYLMIDPGTTVNVPANSLVDLKAYQSCSGLTRTLDTNGTFNFENLNISGVGGCGGNSNIVVAGGSSIVVKKNFSLGATMNANFDISVEGNVTTVGSPTGSMAISMTTAGATTFTQAAAGMVSGLVSVNKPGGTMTTATNLVFNNAGQDINISNGTVNLAGYNLTVNDVLTIGASGKLICNGGTVAAASWSVSGEVSCGTSIGITWTGLAGDHLWSTPGNWTNNTVPGASDIAIFNGMCAGVACHAQIDSNLSVRGITMAASYTGTLTQNSGQSLTIGTAGFSQSAGTFAGGDSAVTMNGVFLLSGGTYTATSSTWTMNGTTFTVSGAPAFNHNSGLLKFYSISTNQNITPSTVNYYNVSMDYSGWTTKDLQAGTMTVENNLTLAAYVGCGSWCSMNNGTIQVKKNLLANLDGSWGTAAIVMSGNTNQNIDATGGSVNVAIPKLTIASTGGTVSFLGSIFLFYDYTYSSGTVDPGLSTLKFIGAQNIVPGNINYYNVELGATGWSTKNLQGNTLKVSNQLTLNSYLGCGGYCVTNNGNIELTGHLVTANSGMQGTAILKIVGTGNQSLTGAATAGILSTQITSTGGTVTLAGTLYFLGDYTYNSGTIDAGTSTVYFDGTSTVTPGNAITYNNVNLYGYTTTLTFVGQLNVNGTFTSAGSSTSPRPTASGGTINAFGPVNLTNFGFIGTTVLNVTGSGNQTITGAVGSSWPAMEIASTGGTVTFSGTIWLVTSYNFISGVLNSGTSTLYLSGPTSIIPSSVIYNNVTIDGYTTTTTLTGTLEVNGTLTLGGGSASPPMILNGGIINAYGNVVYANFGLTGTTLLNMIGASSSTLTTGTSIHNLSTTNVIAKTGGASVVLAANGNYTVLAGRDLTVDSGTLDLAGYDLTVIDVISINVGATLKCNGGEFSAGSLSNSGTVNCPGYSTYDFNWTGAGGNTDWSTAGNWQGGVAPGASDIAAFQNSTCGIACDATISAPINVRGVRIFSPYSGAITQGSGQAITIGSRGWSQPAGTFIGSDADITYNGLFNLSGGTYTSTSAITYPRSVTISGAPVFNHNNGTWTMLGFGSTMTSTNAFAFNNVNFGGFEIPLTVSGTLRVNGNLGFQDSGSYWTYAHIDGGVIEAYGDISNSGRGKAGSTELRIMGNASGQTITGATDPASFPALKIQAGANTVHIVGSVTTATAFTYISGTLDFAGGSALQFNNATGGGSQSITPGTATYGNIIFNGYDTAFNLNGGTMTVAGNLSISDTGGWPGLRLINNGTINVSGNVSVLNNGSNGSANINFVGTTNTTLSMSASGYLPQGTMTINKSAPANLTLLTHARFNGIGTQNLTIGADSTLDMDGFNLAVGNNIANSGVLRRGAQPSCGTITQGGSFTGNAAICP